ncbi:MAG: hypothetical protein ACJ77K_05165 [Bacteroidia bacterium]
MSNSMTKHFLFSSCLLFLAHITKAQDTIFTRAGESIPAKVLEITPGEVKYKKSYMLDGPSYVLYKSDVKAIRYSNGQREEFAETPKPAEKVTIDVGPTVTGTSQTNEQQKAVPADQADYYGGGYTYAPGNQIDCIGGSSYRFQNKKIKEKKAYSLMNETGDKKIIALIGKARDKHKLQYLGYAAFPLGIISLVTYSSAIRYTHPPAGSGIKPQVQSINYGQQGVAYGIAIVAAACPVFSIKAKIDRKKYNRQAVKLYNEKF